MSQRLARVLPIGLTLFRIACSHTSPSLSLHGRVADNSAETG
jgi:hypothetical protein